MPFLWHGHRVGLVETGVKQGDPAGPLFFAVSTFDLFESIREAAEKLVVERFSKMPSSYVCDDDLKVTVGIPGYGDDSAQDGGSCLRF